MKLPKIFIFAASHPPGVAVKPLNPSMVYQLVSILPINNIMSRSAFVQISILSFCLLICFPTISFAQVPSSDVKNDVELGREIWYDSLEEAMKEPEKVYKLNLSGQKLKEIPADVFKLTNLHMLDLRDNKLDEVPSDIKDLSKLTMLNMYDNKLRIIHPDMQYLTHLRQLYLGKNKLVAAPAFFGGLGSLRKLDLSRNYVTVYELQNLQSMLPNCSIIPRP